MGALFSISLAKTLHNNGPAGPVNVSIITSVTSPLDCTVTAAGSNPTSATLDVSVAQIVNESFNASCTARGSHIFYLQNCLVYVIDPDTGNNCRTSNVTVMVLANCTRFDGRVVQVAWDTPAGDEDCDGFPSSVKVGSRGAETFITTLPQNSCCANSTPNNEPLPDQWPVDYNDDQRAALGDVLSINQFFNKCQATGGYDIRHDLNQDNCNTLADVLIFNQFFNRNCVQ